MLQLKARNKQSVVEPEPGFTILDLALKSKVEWGFSCTRGTCARCRCLILEGQEFLEEPTEAEDARLEPDELESGYRLACQCVIKQAGAISVTHRPYF
ncbi:2Fe-2S iron-sulfur cluster-binding protein [Paenibacillus eucommiae]|uniref:2Fe-2S ferredoxin n=1 Tax=Paenibacillus eucommiae TaxID=1355755 RepID=A0ABS4IMU7_9BACL|nr:2Fe-2S iron-sulfur cluster-binding protein [Paenibacillus eucommiae]MBP1988902.1 2Fe-2S ferredoxin [Paenibacillus eucommiae]